MEFKVFFHAYQLTEKPEKLSKKLSLKVFSSSTTAQSPPPPKRPQMAQAGINVLTGFFYFTHFLAISAQTHYIPTTQQSSTILKKMPITEPSTMLTDYILGLITLALALHRFKINKDRNQASIRSGAAP